MADMLADVKYQVAVANRVLWALGLATGVTASLGHASRRVPGQPDRFVVKGRGYRLDALAAMRPEDMVVCDTIAEMSGRTPLAELPHCKEPIARASREPRVGGVWQYYTAEVSKDL